MEGKITLVINFVEGYAETHKRIDMDKEQLYSTLFSGAFSDKVGHIHIVCDFIGSKVLKALKVCLVRGIAVNVNGKEITEWEDLRPYQQSIIDFINDMEVKEETASVLNLIVGNTVLIRKYTEGIEELHRFLDDFIKSSGYDVSMSSATTYDKRSCGSYEDRTGHRVQFALNYTPTGTTYHVSLLDKLNMYMNVCWYKEHGFTPERNDEEIVVPVSACDLSTQMLFYGD